MSKEVPEDQELIRQLQQLLAAVEAAGQAVLPSSNLDLLQSIVDAAARIFGAAAASICLLNEAEQVLEFKVAYGDGQGEVVGLRIPVDKGIAGYVAMTGQPIAISDVRRDPRFHQSFAESTGYVPNSILATPLISGDRVIGVMEVLDKINATSFGMQDMELLGVFAQQAALAINQSQLSERLGETLVGGLRSLAEGEEALPGQGLAEILNQDLLTDPSRHEILELAAVFNEVSALGEAERRMCLQIMAAFGRYARSRPKIR